MTAPVSFLLLDSTGHGGLARTVLNLANQLVAHRPVRVISVLRRGQEPRYTLDPRIEHEVLVDLVKGPGPLDRARHRRPSRLVPQPPDDGPGDGALTGLVDHALRRRLSRLEPGTLVTTRPTLHLAATRWRAKGVRVVGWDHLNYPCRYRQPWLASVLDAAIPSLDAWVVLTDADACDYRERFALGPERVRVIRNALSWAPAAEPAPLEAKRLVAAGRLVPVKGFSRLIDAFAGVARMHPDWSLDIHGEGPRREALQARIDAHGIDDRVRLAGYVDDMAATLRGASGLAMTSSAEGFPMVLLEAMAEGVPMVAMDCPRGPAEMVRDGENGFLVAEGDVAGFTRALHTLIGDAELRRSLGKQAWLDAESYTTERIVQDWLELLDGVA
ncbi:hypothetical protein GCM10011519_12680 [Marmoricola endophyticus]|uniref:Glycosyltransferase family 4 protein n=1 Tax=Marmoricola endophyticus TaxID=2040280 RepID=A0A917F1A6_9ACTN|nr:glycosyltransferase family 4 protein [Marmoricola endophyticus]GGF40470.1 hypothetical protein GCM10011519_12680 [Marmoricola endophyticus]